MTEKDNKTHQLLIGDDTAASGAAYAKLAGDPRVFTIAKYTKESIDKSVDDLRDKRLLTVDSDKISKVELIGKKEDIEFGRSKDEWQIVKPKPMRADSAQVDELVSSLTDAKMDTHRLRRRGQESAFGLRFRRSGCRCQSHRCVGNPGTAGPQGQERLLCQVEHRGRRVQG